MRWDMKTYNKLLFLLLLMLGTLYGQVDNKKTTKEKSADTFSEIGNGNLTLHFFDALSGKPIKDANIEIEGIGNVKTDFNGRAYFKLDDMDRKLIVKFIHPDYITSEFDISIMVGTVFLNRFSISPKMAVGKLRVVLDWGNSPEDLDAHLVKYDSYHISYRNMSESDDKEAKLDRDDTDFYGPETITVNAIDKDANYRFYIFDYSNRSNDSSIQLSNSKATIKIYGGDNELLGVKNVPSDLIGNQWNVFEIINGKLIL